MKRIMLIAVLTMVSVGCMGLPTPCEGGYSLNPLHMLHENCPEGTILTEYRIPNDESAWQDGLVSQFCMDSRGLTQGPYRGWDDGVLEKEGQYVNNKNAKGTHFRRQYDGSTMMVEHLDDEEINIIEVEYHLNGRIASIRPMTCGLENGLMEWYRENGALGGYCSFTAGWRDGVCASFYSDGSLHGESEYDRDRLLRVVNSYSPVTFVDSNGDGYVERHDKQGLLRGRGPYKNGLKQGCWEYVNPSNDYQTAIMYHEGNIVTTGNCTFEPLMN